MSRLMDFIWDHALGPTALILVAIFVPLGLCAADVPAWAIRGIAAVETGVHWQDTGDIRGKWQGNATGDVGPWHMSMDVLADLKLSHQAARIDRDPVYAESVARRWLIRLHDVTGDWHQAVAAWRAGLRNRHRAYARDYAQRAFNYGTSY